MTAISMPSRRNTVAAVREVDRRQLDLLVGDVLPDVELGPVREREHADVLALAVPAVVEVPQLGPLVLRVPLAELVAEREEALLGARLLLVAAGAAHHRVEPVLLDRVEQRGGLQPVARRAAGRCPRRRGPCRSTPAPTRRRGATPSRSTAASRNSITSGKLCPVSTCITGNGSRAGQNAFLATCSITTLSLPPEKSSTGRSNSAATSRRRWIDSASSASRCEMRSAA